ncbi:MAG: glycosyltransferase family 4 protein [Duganella sp.]
MLTIAHLTSAHPRHDSRIFGKQCRTLADHGHRVALIVADGRGDECRNGVHILDAGAARGRLQRMAAATTRVYLCALALAPDVVQLHDPELLPAGLLLLHHGCKVIFDAHEDVPRQLLGKPYLAPWARRTLADAYARFERLACRRFDGVITATPFIRDRFLTVNRATVDINNFPMPEEFGADLAWADKPLQVCYAGGLTAIRGIGELVRACELLQTPVRLQLAGSFSEPALAARMRARPGWRRIDALGTLGRADIAALLGASRAGLVTLHPTLNHVDALPVKMFEYMAAGIPVIASDFPRWRAIVEGADGSGSACGLCVDPRDPAAIAAAIDYLAGHPDIARRMGENGRRAVRTRYNWRSESTKLIEFYEHL